MASFHIYGSYWKRDLQAGHKRQQGIERLPLGSDWQDYGLVFPTTIGTPYTLSSLTDKWLKPALKKAKLTGFSLYSLRHSHATLSLANGVNAKVASERFGPFNHCGDARHLQSRPT